VLLLAALVHAQAGGPADAALLGARAAPAVRPHLWRWLPLPLLERLLGRVLVIKAFKPLSAAIPNTQAAA
jgi:hypothetical protein